MCTPILFIGSHLDVEARIFQLASAIAAVEPDAIFCGSTAALLYGIGSAYSLLNAVQMLLPRSVFRQEDLSKKSIGN